MHTTLKNSLPADCFGRPRGGFDRHGGNCRSGCLARLPGKQSERPVPLVPWGSAGADRQPRDKPGPMGLKRLPHLLVRLLRPGECRPEHLRGRDAAAASAPDGSGAVRHRPKQLPADPGDVLPEGLSSSDPALDHRSLRRWEIPEVVHGRGILVVVGERGQRSLLARMPTKASSIVLIRLYWL